MLNQTKPDILIIPFLTHTTTIFYFWHSDINCYSFYNAKNEHQPQHQNQSERLKNQTHQGNGSFARQREKSGLNPALLFVEPSKDPDVD